MPRDGRWCGVELLTVGAGASVAGRADLLGVAGKKRSGRSAVGRAARSVPSLAVFSGAWAAVAEYRAKERDSGIDDAGNNRRSREVCRYRVLTELTRVGCAFRDTALLGQQYSTARWLRFKEQRRGRSVSWVPRFTRAKMFDRVIVRNLWMSHDTMILVPIVRHMSIFQHT